MKELILRDFNSSVLYLDDIEQLKFTKINSSRLTTLELHNIETTLSTKSAILSLIKICICLTSLECFCVEALDDEVILKLGHQTLKQLTCLRLSDSFDVTDSSFNHLRSVVAI